MKTFFAVTLVIVASLLFGSIVPVVGLAAGMTAKTLKIRMA
jgi:hypothetical protein